MKTDHPCFNMPGKDLFNYALELEDELGEKGKQVVRLENELRTTGRMLDKSTEMIVDLRKQIKDLRLRLASAEVGVDVGGN